jgi:hypothetical protein
LSSWFVHARQCYDVVMYALMAIESAMCGLEKWYRMLCCQSGSTFTTNLREGPKLHVPANYIAHYAWETSFFTLSAGQLRFNQRRFHFYETYDVHSAYPFMVSFIGFGEIGDNDSHLLRHTVQVITIHNSFLRPTQGHVYLAQHSRNVLIRTSRRCSRRKIVVRER